MGKTVKQKTSTNESSGLFVLYNNSSIFRATNFDYEKNKISDNSPFSYILQF